MQTAPALTSSAILFPFVRQGTVDVSGGHHDAGDYSKYTINSASLIHYLMFSVDSLPGVNFAPEFMQAVFSAAPKSPPVAVPTQNGVVVFQVNEVQPPPH